MGDGQQVWEGKRTSVRSNVTSGRNWHLEWHQDGRNAEVRKIMSNSSRCWIPFCSCCRLFSIEFVTGTPGPRKIGPVALFPTPLNAIARHAAYSLGFPAPVPAHAPTPLTPQTSPWPLKIGGDQRSPIQETSAGGNWMEAEWV